jgi:hypothetical protein
MWHQVARGCTATFTRPPWVPHFTDISSAPPLVRTRLWWQIHWQFTFKLPLCNSAQLGPTCTCSEPPEYIVIALDQLQNVIFLCHLSRTTVLTRMPAAVITVPTRGLKHLGTVGKRDGAAGNQPKERIKGVSKERNETKLNYILVGRLCNLESPWVAILQNLTGTWLRSLTPDSEHQENPDVLKPVYQLILILA